MSCSTFSIEEKKEERSGCERAAMLYKEKGLQGSYQSQLFLDSAIRICPDYDQAYREIGVPYLKRGDYATWLAYIDKAVELAPAEYLGIRAWCKVSFIHDYRGALEDFEALDSLQPGAIINVADNTIYSWMALSKAGLGDMPSALALIDKSIEIAIERVGEDWVGLYDYFYRGNIKLALNDFDGALIDFNKQIGLYKNLADPYYYKGIVLLELGREKEAKRALLEAKLLFTEGYRVHNAYTEVPWQVYENEVEEAIQLLGNNY